MSRIENVAVMGYVPTPLHLIPAIARLLRVNADAEALSYYADRLSVVDPCCGDAEAVLTLCRLLPKPDKVKLYGAELERTRFEQVPSYLNAKIGSINVEHGDAFRVQFSLGSYAGAQILFLNPPYDTLRGGERIEVAFLDRFSGTLQENGVLVLLVPTTSLQQLAPILAARFENLQAFRFPETDFQYRQVCIIGNRQNQVFPRPDLEARVRSWVQAESLPVLGSVAGVIDVPVATNRTTGFETWKVLRCDRVEVLRHHKPWHTSGKHKAATPIVSVLPTASDLSGESRRYTLAAPPKPGHIAAAIAAGVFDGCEVVPDHTNSHLPPLLVKGVFDREMVHERTEMNKEGEVTAEVFVQAPKLVVTVLDLRSGQIRTLRNDTTVRTEGVDLESMTTGELIELYGRSLMQQMRTFCNASFDPTDANQQFPIAPTKIPLFRAQADAVRTLVTILGGPGVGLKRRQRRAAFLIGEVGVGKTLAALATAATVGASRVLVMCPTHVCPEWVGQVSEGLHQYRPIIIDSIDTALEFMRSTNVVGVLSRETAKLGHALESCRESCPSCGAKIPQIDYASQRSKCERTWKKPHNREAHIVVSLLERTLRYALKAERLQGLLPQLFPAAGTARLLERWDASKEWAGVRLDDIDLSQADPSVKVKLGLSCQNWGIVRDALRDRLAEPSCNRDWAASLAAVLELMGQDITEFLPQLENFGTYYPYEKVLDRARREVAEDRDRTPTYRKAVHVNGALCWEDEPVGSFDLFVSALGELLQESRWRTEECGATLYSSTPQPRRVPLADLIVKRKGFDFLILDEGHEYRNENAAQSMSAHKLSGLGRPTLMLTGTPMSGLASSLFTNQWALDRQFRQEFGRDGKRDFIRRYGFQRIRRDENPDKAKKSRTLVHGSVSDRVESGQERVVGEAPGVIGIFLLRYLLRISAVIHKSDVAADLPGHRDIRCPVDPLPEQKAELTQMLTRLVEQAKKDMWKKESGQLLGAIAEAPSYLDRCSLDTGNGKGDHYVAAYPDGTPVYEAPLFDASVILPKEQFMLDTIKAELAEGRRTIVLVRHVNLMDRYNRLIQAHVGPAAILDVGKVPAIKRKEWIAKLVKKGPPTLICNPVAIQTGLNGLTAYQSMIWMENPSIDAILFDQGCGRIHRIGKSAETRVFFPVYTDTVQEAMHRLLMHKVGSSRAVTGLDAESALEAAGVGEFQPMSAMAVSRQIYALIEQELGLAA